MLQDADISIVLASASPRRKQLLTDAGYRFAIRPADIDESAFPTEGVEPREYAERLALAKAKEVAGRLESIRANKVAGLGKSDKANGSVPATFDAAERLALAKAKEVAGEYPDCLVIGADTVADFEGQIIGKPADTEEAEEITKKLFNAPHRVITGLAIVRLSDGMEMVESDVTTVYPRKLTAEQIAEHIKGESWRGKAGAYAIQETGDEFVERIDGSLSNVMGLPMELLERMIERFINSN